MKIGKLKSILNLLPDDLDINYSNGHGFQEITCLVSDKTICLSNTPYEGDENMSTVETIIKYNINPQ